ncbi:MAG: DOMON-like domain-containing protein [Pseudomonadota bacterium]|jgi:hypothetical protein|nr:MAG: hypothetical protein DIU56_00235 [Pseudomonadota bacterium]
MPDVALVPHPSTPCGAIQGVTVAVDRAGSGALRLRYAVRGDLESLSIPAPCEPRRADGLWRHTCFEVFVRTEGPGYLELNLSPSGEWAAYAFEDYRQGMAPAELSAVPRIDVRRNADTLVVDALVRLPSAPRLAMGMMRLALAAVLEARDGRISYWALRHASGKPDFHHVESFALRLDGGTGAPQPELERLR